MKKHWIQNAVKSKGALRRNLHVPAGQRIGHKRLMAAAKKAGKIGKEAKLAITLSKLRKK